MKYVIVTILVIIVVWFLIGMVALVSSQASDREPPATTQEDCFTYCAAWAEFQCENDEFVGGCFGFWLCENENGLHRCVTTPQ